jgi:SSS family solute:Na+ symporter
MVEQLPATHFSFTNISVTTLINWACTIIPIWFIAMTLYQRVYASPSVKEARKAFFIAGVFEYPLMAFAGVMLGKLARMAFPTSEPEMALPLMLTHILPVGISGFLLASYFSAVMSTADSCLIASSGNFTNDILSLFIRKKVSDKFLIRLSQVVTLVVGVLAMLLAGTFQSVLDIVLQAYGFMVSGLLVPTLMAYFSKDPDAVAASASMLGGGGFTLVAILSKLPLPFGLEATVFGIAIAVVLYALVYFFRRSYVR